MFHTLTSYAEGLRPPAVKLEQNVLKIKEEEEDEEQEGEEEEVFPPCLPVFFSLLLWCQSVTS